MLYTYFPNIYPLQYIVHLEIAFGPVRYKFYYVYYICKAIYFPTFRIAAKQSHKFSLNYKQIT